MRIAIVGAGALGRVYGVLLGGQHEVSWVVRPARLAEREPIRIQHAVPFGMTREDAAPRRVAAIPAGTDVAIVTLRFDTIASPGDDLRRALAAPPGTLVLCLSPVFHAQHRLLAELVGHPVVAGMPGVSGYTDERGVVRYWVPAIAATLIDDGTARGDDDHTPGVATDPDHHQARLRLARALTEVGLPARLEADVEAVDAATTTAFFPMIAAIAAGGSVDGVLADRALLEVMLAAGEECRSLAPRLGKPAPWAGLLARLVRASTLRAGVAVARLVAPEPLRFVDAHFGPKLRDQHLAMGEHIASLAAEHGVGTPALRELIERLRAGRDRYERREP